MNMMQQKIAQVAEVISGMMPLNDRTRLKNLIEAGHQEIYVESSRAISRSASVTEDFYKLASQNGVKIIASDLPNLFKWNATPAEAFMRRIMAAVYEFERDCIVHRLYSGLQAAKAKSTRHNQQGGVKVNGVKSILERVQPSSVQLKQMKQLMKKQEKGEIGYRELAKRFSAILQLPTTMSMETSRRMCTTL